MITVEIHKDGELIANVYCMEGAQLPRPPGVDGFYAIPPPWFAYDYEYHQQGKATLQGTVEHYRPNGVAALMKEVFENLETKGIT